jgi:myosin-1
MISSSTWPNFKGSEKDGVATLLKSVDLEKDCDYGKTKIFIRTPQSITTLEDMRSAKIPGIVLLLQRVRH